MLRPCLCGCGKLVQGPRCEASRKAQRAVHRGKYAEGWTATSKAIRDAWVAEHGWLCPGWRDHQPHPTRDLVVDHRRDGTLGILCRAENTAKRNRGDA